MDVYKLYGTATSDTDALATLDIQVDGHIVAVSLEVFCTACDALNDGAQAEVSFASTGGQFSNDTKASIIHAGAYQGFLTTGGSQVRAYSAMSGLAIEVAAGERMYLHADVTGTQVMSAVAYMFVMPVENASARAAARRR